jgi:uroporphyrinogen-III synthase
MSAAPKDRYTPVKSILVSQPKPTEANSPYLLLAEKYKLKIDFRQFIKVEPVPPKEFRKQKIDILKHTAIIFTSRNAIDHFFAICKDFKIEIFLYFRSNGPLPSEVHCDSQAQTICRTQDRRGLV